MSNYRNDNFSVAKSGIKRRVSLCRALADPQRWLILEWLMSQGPQYMCSAGELAARLKIAASTVSHHLRQLEQARLIIRRRQGRHIYCRAQRAGLGELAQYLMQASGVKPMESVSEPASPWEDQSSVWT